MLKEAAKELTLLDFDSKLPIGEIQSNNTATPAPVKDVGSPDGSINLEQVNQAFFGARFWISRARIRQAVTPVELMALVIEYHHHGDKNEFVIETYQALRNAIKKGFLAARSDSMMPLPSLPANDEWIVTVHDAEQFFQSIGLGWSVTKAIEDVFNECVPKATEPQAGTAPVQSTATPAPLLADSDSNSTTPDPERRLTRLRALGGNAAYKHGKWKITGMTALVASEKTEGCKRSDEKTIRADLKEAAENEREAKRANAFSGLGQR